MDGPAKRFSEASSVQCLLQSCSETDASSEQTVRRKMRVVRQTKAATAGGETEAPAV